MERDMDLVRKILLAVESNSSPAPIANLRIDGYSFDTVAWHCQLLYNHGFFDCFKANSTGNQRYYTFWVGNLTWEGAEYLDTIRDESLWGKIKILAKEKGLGLTFDIVKEIAHKIIQG